MNGSKLFMTNIVIATGLGLAAGGVWRYYHKGILHAYVSSLGCYELDGLSFCFRYVVMCASGGWVVVVCCGLTGHVAGVSVTITAASRTSKLSDCWLLDARKEE